MLMGLMPNLYKTYFRLGIRFEARPVYDLCMFCLGHGVFCLSWDDVYIVPREKAFACRTFPAQQPLNYPNSEMYFEMHQTINVLQQKKYGRNDYV